ncbi:MAG: anti-sigma factor antagonist [Clostridia bacterium]|nr:anti-sigma factor antagonist [Clostridia bacterium]
MVVRIETTPTDITAWLSGELDHHTARVMREEIDAAVERSSARLLRLDFSGVGFMDSSGIGLVMGRYRLMQSRGGRVLIVGVSDRLLRVMKLAGLERLPVWENETTSVKRKEAYKP